MKYYLLVTLLLSAAFTRGADPFLKVLNPVREHRLIFTYELKQPGKVEIMLTDTCGEPIMQITSGLWNSGQFYEEYTLPFLPQGVYLLQLNTDKGKVTREVVIENTYTKFLSDL